MTASISAHAIRARSQRHIWKASRNGHRTTNVGSDLCSHRDRLEPTSPARGPHLRARLWGVTHGATDLLNDIHRTSVLDVVRESVFVSRTHRGSRY